MENYKPITKEVRELADKVFHEKISEYNERDMIYMNHSPVVLINDDFAISIFWQKMSWTYLIHRIDKK